MLKRSEYAAAQRRALEYIDRAGIVLTDEERGRVAVADFGLSRLEKEGVEILTLTETGRIAVKILVLFPFQTEPEHWHPQVGTDPGKEETVRHVWGDLYFYVEGEDTLSEGYVPEGKEHAYTLRHEIVLQPGGQLTFQPGEKHWFQAGKRGAVLYSYSTTVRDVLDGFTDPGDHSYDADRRRLRSDRNGNTEDHHRRGAGRHACRRGQSSERGGRGPGNHRLHECRRIHGAPARPGRSWRADLRSLGILPDARPDPGAERYRHPGLHRAASRP